MEGWHSSADHDFARSAWFGSCHHQVVFIVRLHGGHKPIGLEVHEGEEEDGDGDDSYKAEEDDDQSEVVLDEFFENHDLCPVLFSWKTFPDFKLAYLSLFVNSSAKHSRVEH